MWLFFFFYQNQIMIVSKCSFSPLCSVGSSEVCHMTALLIELLEPISPFKSISMALLSLTIGHIRG